MQNLFGVVLPIICLVCFLANCFGPPERFMNRECSGGNCMTYRGPNEKYSLQMTGAKDGSQSEGWIVGEIRAFAFGSDNVVLMRSLAENGWVECAGQLIERKDFPEAAGVLEDTWGSQNASRTRVFLPDLRGLVLRGWHHGRQAPGKYPFSPYTGDIDLNSRVFPRPELLDVPEPGIAGPTDSKTKQVIKDHVGSMQAEQFHGHRHNFSFVAGNGLLKVQGDQNANASVAGEQVRIGSSTAFEGGNETHPPNVYVLYLIYIGRPAYEAPPSEEDQRSAKPRRVQALQN